jgi:hypothetical protein
MFSSENTLVQMRLIITILYILKYIHVFVIHIVKVLPDQQSLEHLRVISVKTQLIYCHLK